MSTMQVYNMQLSPEVCERAEPAQFIFSGNDSDIVCGFIQTINYETSVAMFVLFEPAPAIPTADVIVSHGVSSEDLMALLHKALDLNPSMRPYWQELYDQNDGTLDEQ